MNQRSVLLPSRRNLIAGLGASVIATSLAVGSAQAADQRLVATPRQTRGPYYPLRWVGDIDNDLVKVKGEDARAMGRVLHIHGVVMDAYGQPLPESKIEIWQADAKGIYRHPRDNSGRRRPDLGFQGFGRTVSGQDGSYRFRTIRPTPYPGRTPHIHFRVAAPKRRRLITQMYFADEPANVRDGLLNSVREAERRARLIAKPEPYDHVEAGAERVYFDMVIIGQ